MDEAERLEVLQRYGVLDTPPERDFDDLTRLVARLFGVPLAAVTLLDRTRQWFKASVGLPVRELPREGSPCARQLELAEPLVVDDVQADPRFAEGAPALGDVPLRFYAGVPLRSREGTVLGALCAMDVRPRHLEPGQLELLELLGHQAERLLELRRLERERAEAERGERTRRELLDRIVDQSHDGITVADARGVLCLMNRAAVEQHGRPLRALRVEAWPEAYGLLDEQGRPLRPEHSPLARALRGEHVADARLEVRRPDGTVCELTATAAPLEGADGALAGAVFSTHDVTEQRVLERALTDERRLLREVLHQLPVGVLMMGPRLELANTAAERLVGESVQPPGEESAPRGYRFLQPDGRPYAREQLPLVRALEQGETVRAELVEIERADGTRVWVELTAAPVRGEASGVRAAVAAMVDVTEHRHVLALQRKLLAVAGHDLRNPLYAIQLSAQRLEKEPGLTPGAVQAVARVRRSATRMERLVHDLLDFVSVRSGGALGVHFEPADLGQVCESVVAEFGASHPDRKVELGGEGDGRGEFDPGRLGQLVQNLVGNALQHSEKGAPVRVAWSGQAPGALVLAVHNPGPPIPAELLPHLFEPFRRGGGDGAPGSLGLGLFIVEQVARAHGGQVSVHSAPDEGTTFTVRLPRVAVEQPEPPHPGAGA